MRKRARVLHWMIGVLVLVTAVTLCSLLSRGREDTDRAPGAAADEAPQARSSLQAEAGRRRELQRLIAGRDEASKPGASRRLSYQRVDFDGIRVKHGLPPVMAALREARRYRAPTPAERSHPGLGELYRMDRELHELSWMTRHARNEATRFARDAELEKGGEQRSALEQSAGEYRKLARTYQRRLEDLKHRRGRLTVELAQRKDQ